MEEWIGERWHRWVTARAQASATHAEAAVALADVRRAATLLLHAGGGRVRLAEAVPVSVGGERTAWQRIAGSGRRVPLPQLDERVLALPDTVARHADPSLNRDLYLWWAALASFLDPSRPWVAANRAATDAALQAFPGLQPRFVRLWAAEQALRTPPAPDDRRPAAVAERRLQAALAAAGLPGAVPAGSPGPDRGDGDGDGAGDGERVAPPRPGRVPVASIAAAPAGIVLPAAGLLTADDLSPADVAPLWTWIVPCGEPSAGGADDDAGAARGAAPNPIAGGEDGGRQDLRGRRRARTLPRQAARAPLLLGAKTESLTTFGDPFAIDRSDDDGDDGSAETAAEELESLALQRGGTASARVRFDLDLPSAAADDRPVGPGESLPEWDPRSGTLRPDRVRAQSFVARDGGAPWLPDAALRAEAARVRRRLDLQRAAPRWQSGRLDGEALDLDAWVREAGEPVSGAAAVWRQRTKRQRELATLLLADLSLSTDAHANDRQRVIDVIRDALWVFGEALAGSGDAFGITGFSSVKRQLRLHPLKGLDEPWGPAVLPRLGAIKPGYYTRMGAALRAATRRLEGRPERQRLLLLLTDGKPHDLDGYDGRLGLEDTRQAVLEARRAGLTPFAVGIDDTAPEVLPALFGRGSCTWVRRPDDLPRRLAGLVAQLAR